MLKSITVGVAAIFVGASSLAHAQSPSAGAAERVSAADFGALTDARIAIVKATLQLTSDQERYWPAIEDAIRLRAKDRQGRIASAERTVGERRANPIEAVRDRDPIDFIHRRADALNQRAADLKKLADAWQPLYQTLNPEQKRRMGYLAMYVVREMRDRAEDRRVQSADDAAD
jgi:hypothetical protein